MEYISSKNIFLLLRDTLKLIDRRPMDHGSRAGYLFCKMLECKGGYEQFELADFLMLATLHDIGAYKTDKMGDKLSYEFRDPMPHSIYGFLFLKNISPLADFAKMVLKHRVPCSGMQDGNFTLAEETEILKLAEAAEIFHMAMGDNFSHKIFRRQAETMYSAKSLDLLDEAVEKYDVFSKLTDESYQKELDGLLEYMIFTNEDKKKYIEMLMFCIGFRSENVLVDAVTTLHIAEEIGKRTELDDERREKLYYGTLIHDIGMLSVSSQIIDAPRKLTDDEINVMRSHVEREEKILLNRMDPDVVDIAVAHHERLDGSGYPKGLKKHQMNTEQFILQVADVVTALTCKRSYHSVCDKEKVVEILFEEADKGRLNSDIVNCFYDSYDEIMEKVSSEVDVALEKYRNLNKKYNVTVQNKAK